jgi:Mg-chelatase subunit ChlD
VDYNAAAGDVAVDPSVVQDVRDQWATQGRRSRLLLLMDLSGSMAETLPDGQTRAEAAQEALRGLVAGASPDDALGLWGFTTEVGNGDFEVLLPARPLETSVDGASLRSTFLSQVDRLVPVPGGSTSLYDTLAAAYSTASKRYVDGRFNAVVVVTDGRNEDPGSRSLPALLDEIRRQFDGARPVRIITVAYGQDADGTTLRSLADATAGRSYRALDAEQVQQRLAAALAKL